MTITTDQRAAGFPAPESVADALAAMDSVLGYLRDPGIGSLLPSELGGVVAQMGILSGKFVAVKAAALNRFDAERAYTDDGFGSTPAWLKGRARMTGKAAGAETRRMRQFRAHPVIEGAVAAGELPDDWAAYLAEWTRKLPEDWRHDADKLLVDTASAGASLEDLAVVARAAYEKWRQRQGPDDDGDDDGFEDRYLRLGATFDNAGRVNGNLTPECTAAVQAVLDALGKKDGPEDERTEAQRYHDALQLACELLLRAKLVPGRAGADTRVDAVISLAELLDLPGASQLQDAWLAALAGEHGYLAGKDAEVAACDAIIAPVVTGHPDLAVVDDMIGIILAFLDGTGDDGAGGGQHGQDRAAAADGRAAEGPAAGGAPRGCGARPLGGEPRRGAGEAEGSLPVRPEDAAGCPGGGGVPGTGLRPPGRQWASGRARMLSPQAWQALRCAIARRAVDLVSGPDRLASLLRRGLLEEPYNAKSVVLDVGYSDSVPGSIRRAVVLRARTCEWPGCRKRASYCDVHHLRHKKDGGATSVSSCVLLCQFHHDICIHRWGWRLVLHPDGTTTAYGPKGQVLHSHGPPRGGGPPGSGRPSGGGPPGSGPPGGGGPPGSGPPGGGGPPGGRGSSGNGRLPSGGGSPAAARRGTARRGTASRKATRRRP